MQKRTLIFALFILVLPMVLAACGGGLDEGEFADAVEKAFERGDFGDYNDLVCDDDQIDQDVDSPAIDASVECSVEDDTFECDIEAAGDTSTLTGEVEDDKACNVILGEGDDAMRLVDLLAITAGEMDDVPPADDTEDAGETDDEATPEGE